MNEGHYFAVIHGLRLARNSAQVEENDHYQAIRDEINRRTQAPDWGRIKQHAEALGRETGFTLMAAAYYTTALAKTDGLIGLADGLEIMLAALSRQDEMEPPPNPQVTNNALNWMASRVKEQVKSERVNRNSLSLLYRCERACRVINEKMGTNIPSLQTLQHRTTRQIEQIGKKRPKKNNYQPLLDESPVQDDAPPPPGQAEQEKKSSALLVALALIVVVVLVGELLVWLKDSINHPLDHIAPQTAAPQVLDQQQIQQLRQTSQANDIWQHQGRITALYLDAIERHMQQHKAENITQAEQLLDTLGRLYPGSHQVMQQKASMRTWRTDQKEQIGALLQRFKAFRTHAANLNQTARNLNSDSRQLRQIKTQARNLEKYAISLSPLLGRSLYIEDQLEQKNYLTARRELSKLNQQIDALAMYASMLQKTLEQDALGQQTLTPDDPRGWAFF